MGGRGDAKLEREIVVVSHLDKRFRRDEGTTIECVLVREKQKNVREAEIHARRKKGKDLGSIHTHDGKKNTAKELGMQRAIKLNYSLKAHAPTLSPTCLKVDPATP